MGYHGLRPENCPSWLEPRPRWPRRPPLGQALDVADGEARWDLTCQKGAEFSAVVEDCVGIGRFAGACVMAHPARKDEPVLFRRCYFLNLDWWGDAGGVYVRGESRSMPAWPHATFDDCTIVGPDNALQAGWPGVDDLCTRVKFKDCRLIVLNFSQPQGNPSSGTICCGCKDGKQVHVDFEARDSNPQPVARHLISRQNTVSPNLTVSL